MKTFIRGLSREAKIGGGLGAAAGAISGSGVFENEQERENTSLGNRLARVGLGAVGGGALGAAGGQALALRKPSSAQTVDVGVQAASYPKARGYADPEVSGVPGAVANAVGQADKKLYKYAKAAQERKLARDLERKPPEKQPFWNRPLWGDRSGVDKFRDLTGLSANMKNFAYFESPEVLQRQIQYGTTTIPDAKETETLTREMLGDKSYGNRQAKKSSGKKMKVPAGAAWDVKRIKAFLESESIDDNL